MHCCRVLIAVCCLTIVVTDSYVQAQPPGRAGGRGEQSRGQQSRGEQGRGAGGGPGQGRRAQGGRSGQQMPPWVRLFDADSDGELSASEINNATTVLIKLDRNGDGVLSDDELRPPRGSGGESRSAEGRRGGGQADSRGGPAMRGQQRRQGGPGRSGGNGGPGSGAVGGGRGGDPAQADAAFAAEIMLLDANKDGLIAVEELPEHMHEAFETADADKSGTLNQNELLKLASQFRRNKLNPDEGQEMKNAPTQGRRGPG